MVHVDMQANVPKSEFSQIFVTKMLNAMMMSFFKYGLVAEAYPHKVNALESLYKRLEAYRETGNTDYLVDVANFAMIEFMHPKHPHASCSPTDSNKSTGRVWNTGAISEQANTHEREAVRNPRRDGD